MCPTRVRSPRWSTAPGDGRTATPVRSSGRPRPDRSWVRRAPSLLGELQPLVVADKAADHSHVDVLRDPLPGQLVRRLRVTLGLPGAHRDQLVAPNHDAVGNEARLTLEDGQDAGPGLADDLLGITGEHIDHASAVWHGCSLTSA